MKKLTWAQFKQKAEEWGIKDSDFVVTDAPDHNYRTPQISYGDMILDPSGSIEEEYPGAEGKKIKVLLII